MEAEAELKRGIDSDWKTCVLKYPEILDYYFSMIKVNVPNEGSSLGSRSQGDPTGDSETWGPGSPTPFAPNFPFDSELKKDKRRGMRKERNGSDGFANLAGPGIPVERPPIMERPATVQPGTTNRRRTSESHYYTIAGGRRPPPQGIAAPPPPPSVPMPPHGGGPPSVLPGWMRPDTRYHM